MSGKSKNRIACLGYNNSNIKDRFFLFLRKIDFMLGIMAEHMSNSLRYLKAKDKSVS